MTRPLSPEAQEVYVAFEDAPTPELALANALRALVGANAYEVTGEGWYSLVIDVDDIYAIADELEGK